MKFASLGEPSAKRRFASLGGAGGARVLGSGPRGDARCQACTRVLLLLLLGFAAKLRCAEGS